MALSLTDNSSPNPTTATLTISSAAFGTAASDRVIVVVFGWGNIGGTSTLSSVTIGGITASQLITKTQGNATVEAWAAAVSTGTTGAIVATFSVEPDASVSVGVFRLTETSGSSSPSDSASASAAASTSVSTSSVTIPSSGAGLFATCLTDDDAVTWTNATESYDHDLGADQEASAALTTTAGTPTVTATTADSNGMALIGLAWTFGGGGGGGGSGKNFGVIII